jgi:hypothetical protein
MPDQCTAAMQTFHLASGSAWRGGVYCVIDTIIPGLKRWLHCWNFGAAYAAITKILVRNHHTLHVHQWAECCHPPKEWLVKRWYRYKDRQVPSARLLCRPAPWVRTVFRPYLSRSRTCILLVICLPNELKYWLQMELNTIGNNNNL